MKSERGERGRGREGSVFLQLGMWKKRANIGCTSGSQGYQWQPWQPGTFLAVGSSRHWRARVYKLTTHFRQAF